MIDKLIEKLAAIGIPMLVLNVTVLLTGNNGASGFTDGIEDLGFGFGMSGGVFFLILLALFSEFVTRLVFEKKLDNMVKKMKSENMSRIDIINVLGTKIMYSKDLRNRTLVKLALAQE